uniref:Uncharacterized protein n=1 Tax=Panagrellus redivivus TaxID=6233 RepID=A0A7E4VQN7_PANRE
MSLIHLYYVILAIVKLVRIGAYPSLPIVPGNDPPSYSYLDRVLTDSDDGYRYIRLMAFEERILYIRKALAKTPFIVVEQGVINTSRLSEIQILWFTGDYDDDKLMFYKYSLNTKGKAILSAKCYENNCNYNFCEDTSNSHSFRKPTVSHFTNVILMENVHNYECSLSTDVAALTLYMQGSYAIARFHQGYHLSNKHAPRPMTWHEVFQAYDVSFPDAPLPKKVVIRKRFNKNEDLPERYKPFLTLDHGLDDLKTARFDMKKVLLNEKFEFLVDEHPHGPMFVFDDYGCDDYHIQLKLFQPSLTHPCLITVKKTKTKYEIYGDHSSSKIIIMIHGHVSTSMLKFNLKEKTIHAVYGFEYKRQMDACLHGFDMNILAFEVAKMEFNRKTCDENFYIILRYRVYMIETATTSEEEHSPSENHGSKSEKSTTKKASESEELEVAEASLISEKRRFPLWMLLIIIFILLFLIITTIIFWLCIPGVFISKQAQKLPCLRRFHAERDKPRRLTATDMASLENKSHVEAHHDESTKQPTAESANQSPNSPTAPTGQCVVMQHTTKSSRTMDSQHEPNTVMGKAFSSRHRRWSNFYEKKPDFLAAVKTDYSKVSRKLILPDFFSQLVPVVKFTDGKIAAEQEDVIEPNSRVYFYLRDATSDEHSLFGKFAVRVAEPFSNDDIPANIRERDPSSLRKTPFYVMKVYILSKDPPGFEIHYRGNCPYFLQALACENCDTVVPQFGRSKLEIMSLYIKEMPAGYHYHASICLGDDDNDLSKYVNIFAYRAHRKHQEVKTGVMDVFHINNLNLEPIHETANEKYSAELKRIVVPEGGKQVKVMVDRAEPSMEPMKGGTDPTQMTQTPDGDKKAKVTPEKKSLDKTQPTPTEKTVEKKSKS